MTTTRQDANRLKNLCFNGHDNAYIIPVRAESKLLGWKGRARMLAAIQYGLKHQLFEGYESMPGWWVLYNPRLP